MSDKSTTSGDGATPFVPRVWRIPLWIRIACLAQALGWLALCAILGLTGREGPLFWGVLATFVLAVPYLVIRPAIRLRADGTVRLYGWIHTRGAQADQITRLSMTQYGLRLSFADGSRFTSVVFQSTYGVWRPRVLEFVEAIAGQKDLPSFDPWSAAQEDGIELYTKRGSDPDSSHRP
jgi:hypothetical protein